MQPVPDDAARPAAADSETDPEGFELLKEKVSSERGFNCRYYKTKCLRRRIAVRMRASHCRSYEEYARKLDEDAGEYDLLLDTLTINVSKFQRNPETWAIVERVVIPDIFESVTDRDTIWSAGSAAGEEAYTISMLLHEHAARLGADGERRLKKLRILGTDIDRHSLEAARRAEYPELAMADIDPQRLERWFSPGPPYRVRDELRRNVSFVRSDLISDPPETNVRAIFCRNVIIYFDREIQEILFRKFFDALAPGGYLVLGKVETLLGDVRQAFEAISNRERVFRKPGIAS